MAFHDVSFLFLLLPAVLLAHRLIPGVRGKNLALLAGSMVFLAWGTPVYLVLMALVILFNYYTGLEMAVRKEENRENKSVLLGALAANLLLLGFFQYGAFLVDTLNRLFDFNIPIRQLPMPVGLAFVTLSVLSYLFDVYRDKVPASRDILVFSLYITFFPKLACGPIMPYDAMERQLREHRKVSPVKFGKGCRLFLLGLSKKVLLAENLATTFHAIAALPQTEISMATAWLGALTCSLMVYFSFGGYSDMALGLGQMLGFDLEKNFDYPYGSASVSEFWQRWHISLGAWFREYVYLPLGGDREDKGRKALNLLIVWALTGIWYGAGWNFLIWGLYFGGLLVLEAFLPRNLPRFLGRLGTVLAVVVGWVIFFAPSLGHALTWLGRMLGIGAAGVVDDTALYYLAGSCLLLVLSLLGVTPLCADRGNKLLKDGGRNLVYVSVAWFALLLILCIAGMLAGGEPSLLYFRP